MRVFDRFKPTRTSKLPSAYLIPAGASKVVDMLRLQGIKVEQLIQPWSGSISVFSISESIVARNAFQGHRLVRLEGKYGDRGWTSAAGSYVVRTAQPLGVLAFDLLEAESLDGVAAWGLFGEDWSQIKEFPIGKVFGAVNAVTVALD